MLSILCVRLTIKVKVGMPESFKVVWYPPEKTGSSHLNEHQTLYSITPLLNDSQVVFSRTFGGREATTRIRLLFAG